MPKAKVNFLWVTALAFCTVLGISSYAQQTGDASAAAEVAAPTMNYLAASEKILPFASAAFGLTILLHVGFAMYEGGLIRKRFAMDAMIRKVLLLAVAILASVLIGYAIKGADKNHYLYPVTASWSYLDKPDPTILCDMAFFALWCATAITLVTGALAERVRLKGMLVFGALFSAILFPVTQMWASEGSWLGMLEGEAGFRDLGAGSIHIVGGAMALAGAMVLGARLNKFKNGKSWAFPGHNIMLAAGGVAAIWLGWGGTQIGYFATSEKFALIAVNFSVSGIAGMLAAAGASLFVYKKADFSLALSGFLGGLVVSTGGIFPIYNAVAIGLVAGLLVVWCIGFLDKILLDDPVGAIPIHLLCGIWGSIAFGILGEEASLKQFLYQLTGAIALGVLAFGFAFAIFTILKIAGWLRVSEEEELERGLNLSEEAPEAAPANIPTTTSETNPS